MTEMNIGIFLRKEGGMAMQFSGIGDSHSADVHHVTNCMRDHSHFEKREGAAASAASPVSSTQNALTQVRQEGQFSLSAWLERTFGNGKRLLGNIWGGSDAPGLGEAGDKSGAAQALAQIREDGLLEGANANVAGLGHHQPDAPQTPHISWALHTPQIAAAATAIRPAHAVGSNPYFSAIEDAGRQEQTLWQKARVKFENVAGQLAGHLPRRFFNFQAKSAFHEKQEKPKEDLRKRSKFRRDEVEIDCVLTEDSYLLDSYDRKGEYRQLSAR